jgi:hypothetical protein
MKNEIKNQERSFLPHVNLGCAVCSLGVHKTFETIFTLFLTARLQEEQDQSEEVEEEEETNKLKAKGNVIVHIHNIQINTYI